MMLVAGKLYVCEEYFLMLYPDKKAAAGLRLRKSCAAEDGRWHAAFWSKRVGKPVSFIEKNIPILILNNEEEYIEVLAGDQKGWIIYVDRLNLKRIG